MKRFPNKLSILFIVGFFGIYLAQQPQKREDWPFSYFGMYKGGRYLTKPLFKFRLVYRDSQHVFSPYDFPVDYYFVDERLRELILGTKEDINNDLLSLGTEVIAGSKESVDLFLRENILSVIKEYCKECRKGELSLEVQYWDNMTYDNFHSPDKVYIYTRLSYEP
jgi:hypothetical protein